MDQDKGGMQASSKSAIPVAILLSALNANEREQAKLDLPPQNRGALKAQQLFKQKKTEVNIMGNGEVLNRIERIDEQVHDLKKMVLSGGGKIKKEEATAAAKAWLEEAKKIQKAWPKAPSVLEMTKKDRRHTNAADLH